MPTTLSSYLPGSQDLSHAHSLSNRPELVGVNVGDPWVLGTAVMRARGFTQRQHAILRARLGGYDDSLYRAAMDLERSGNRSADGRSRAATEPALDAWRPTDPGLIASLNLGNFQYSAWPGDLILPEIMVDPLTDTTSGAQTIELPQWGDEHFELHNTARGMNASYNFSDMDPTTVSKKLAHYGFSTRKDTRVVNLANDFLQLSARHQALALRAVLLDRERAIRNLILNTTPYTAGHAVALTTEWDNASGDSLADWDALFATMLASSGLPRELLTVTLGSYDSMNAAFNDPTFIAARTSTRGRVPDTPNLGELANYWRVARVTVADCRANVSGTIQSLWGDVAVAHWAGDSEVGVDLTNLAIDDFYGSPLLGGTFVGNPGIANAPFEDRSGGKTQMVWPVDMSYVPWVTNYQVLGLLTNVKE